MRFFLLLFACGIGYAEVYYDELARLERDLCLIREWQCSPCRSFPVTYNAILEGGYLLMPSARMGETGEISLGFASVPPYYNWNLRCELLPHFEISGSYRVFRGVEDKVLSRFGFGDFSDKGVNMKFAAFLPEDSEFRLPGLAVGWNDFLGTKAFQSKYIALTYVRPEWNAEATLGFGWKRIKGFFGGLAFYPFRSLGNMWLDGISLNAEYDATDYALDPHPRARTQDLKLNFGLKYRAFEAIDLTFSYLKGQNFSFAGSVAYNFGNTEGFLPKIHDAAPYSAPRDFEPIGTFRSEDLFTYEMASSFCEQGFYIERILMYYDSCNEKVLKITFENEKYWQECQVRERLTQLIAALLPEDIDIVYAVQMVGTIPIQEYKFYGNFLRQYFCQEMCSYEFAVVSPLGEVTCNDTNAPHQMFYRRLPLFTYTVLPRTHYYFGSSEGKFRYGAGLTVGFDGTLPWGIQYHVQGGMLIFSNIHNSSDIDILNPSQLINVHTQVLSYERQRGLLLDEGFLEKSFAIGNGHYGRVSSGYFNNMYFGLDMEYLFYPVCSPFAIGLDGAIVKRRTLTGLGLYNNIRKLNGYIPSYVPFLGSQFFLDLYYDWHAVDLAFRLSSGKFLANDWGTSLQVARVFPSGLQIKFWYTWTNGRDQVNGSTYYDKGIGISMPLDIFLTCSSKTRVAYEMSAWLRDVGYRTPAGTRLYDSIYYERQ